MRKSKKQRSNRKSPLSENSISSSAAVPNLYVGEPASDSQIFKLWDIYREKSDEEKA